MPTYFAEGIAPDQMNTIWKKCTIVQFYLIHVGIRVLSPLHLWKHPLKTIVFKEREGGKNRTKKPNQTKKKKSMQLIHSEHFCK